MSDYKKILAMVHQTAAQYPGGIRAAIAELVRRDGGNRRESTLYADINPNSEIGKLKLRDFVELLDITGDISPLRYIAAAYGYTLTSNTPFAPDAPTLEGEMLQDYPSLVDFHKAVTALYSGDGSEGAVLAKLDAALTDIRQTAVMAIQQKGGGAR